MKGITQMEKEKLDSDIKMEEVSKCLMKTRNNVAPGSGGFTGAFYKVFWCYLKHVVLGAIHQIFKDKSLPISLRLGIIALIPKGACNYIDLIHPNLCSSEYISLCSSE